MQKENKCLACHHEIIGPYNFCSLTCAALCGYFSVRKGWIKDPSKITQEEKNKFFHKPAVRDNYPDKDKHL